MGSPEIFRKVSLERLSSPEELDKLMTITSPIGWVSILALGMIIIITVIWSYFGAIPTVLSGTGLLMETGGVSDIVSQSNGYISDIRVNPGDIVYSGQAVARVDQMDLLGQIKNAKMELDVLNRQYEQMKGYTGLDTRLSKEYEQKQKSALEKKIADANTQIEWLKEKISDQEALLKDGLITKQDLITSKQSYDTALSNIKDYQSQLEQVSVQTIQHENTNRQTIANLQQQINSKESNIKILQNRYDLNAAVVSYYTGKIIGISAGLGTYVQANTPIASIELIGANIINLRATLYVTSADAKRIQSGMMVQLSPDTAQKDMYGYMLGIVTYVSGYPATAEDMMNKLHNKNMVDTITKNGLPFSVIVDFIPTSDTTSGYKWSSPRGGKLKVTAGTLCTATFIVDEQKPISYVIPLFKKYVLGQ
ncbi:NHLP bacteriocin system secretion protein [Candidatus Magnetominusculus xianensis]|uniref:Efflux pump membrane fusion protein n=1 Tax=Candidatus Magnetominusculus xianensis TaxID=1748249 RepID=A0ABR5SBW5_9BACT|nr:NHLP bacteriocin system secretion protein [Candidatus Magnetominusculus xianensis]KWT78328.1 putative efflux pump membrane fusion protein [Candidatus Magnetominusculus xianensis]MBF0402866.1 NHLP bacteriocin system secretion protein [Nitrospirota bacterium]